MDFFNRINTSKFVIKILLSGIKSRVTSFKWKTRKKDSDASKDCSFKNYPTLEGCTYHLDKNKDYINDNVTYVTLEIYIDGVS